MPRPCCRPHWYLKRPGNRAKREAARRSRHSVLGGLSFDDNVRMGYLRSVKCTLTDLALLLVLSPIALGQTLNRVPDCQTLKYMRHKVSCLCGSVQVCSGDICGRPTDYELDDEITVELRSKSGTTLDTQKAVVVTRQEQGTTQSGANISFKLMERRFKFEDEPEGEYLLAFILHKSGVPQPALIFPTKYSHKEINLGNTAYMLEPTCPRSSDRR